MLGIWGGPSCWRNMTIATSICYGVCSVQFSPSVMSDSLQPHGMQHARPPYLSPTPGVYQTHHQVGDAIQHLILCRPLLLLPPIPPRIRVFSNESTLHMRWPKPHLIMVYDHFNVLLNSVCQYFIDISVSMFIRNISL